MAENTKSDRIWIVSDQAGPESVGTSYFRGKSTGSWDQRNHHKSTVEAVLFHFETALKI